MKPWSNPARASAALHHLIPGGKGGAEWRRKEAEDVWSFLIPRQVFPESMCSGASARTQKKP